MEEAEDVEEVGAVEEVADDAEDGCGNDENEEYVGANNKNDHRRLVLLFVQLNVSIYTTMQVAMDVSSAFTILCPPFPCAYEPLRYEWGDNSFPWTRGKVPPPSQTHRPNSNNTSWPCTRRTGFGLPV